MSSVTRRGNDTTKASRRTWREPCRHHRRPGTSGELKASDDLWDSMVQRGRSSTVKPNAWPQGEASGRGGESAANSPRTMLNQGHARGPLPSERAFVYATGVPRRAASRRRQRLARRRVGAAVDARRAEVTLKGLHDLLEPRAVGGGHLDAIAVRRERPLQRRDRLALVAGAQAQIARAAPAATQSPMPARASRAQSNFSPGSRFRPGATSECASTRSGGMAWRLRMSRQSASTAAHLRLGEIGIVEIVAGIVDLDADRAGIDVGLARPTDSGPHARRARPRPPSARCARPRRRGNGRRLPNSCRVSQSSAASANSMPV